MDVFKNNLSEILGFIKYKVDNNLCTQEEIESVSRMVQENLEVYGTIEDFAKYFGVPEVNVRNTIHRKVFDRPRRKVYYKFIPFLKAAPDKWKNKKVR